MTTLMAAFLSMRQSATQETGAIFFVARLKIAPMLKAPLNEE